MSSTVDLINKIAKLSIGDNPIITPGYLADVIYKATYFEMEVDYDRPAKDIILASDYGFACSGSEKVFQSNDKGKKRVRFQYLKNSIAKNLFHPATGFELISFYEKFKKVGLIAMGSCQKSGDTIYFPSVSYDKRLVISVIKTSGEAIYRPLVVIR